ncbi:hypothetical protein ACFLS7_00940 [Bacteroidota bacterium]
MTTFDQIVVKCPNCSSLMMDYELMSYTTHGSAEYFSDGKSDSLPSMNNTKGIGICSECAKPFWRGDAKVKEDQIDREGMEDLPNVNELYTLISAFDEEGKEKKIHFYTKLIENDFAKTEWQEYHLREQLWWSINDLIRHLAGWSVARNPRQFWAIMKHRKVCKKLFKKYQPLLEEILSRMIFLYIKSADVDLLYLANMYREKGDFNKALDILSKVEGKRGAGFKKIQRKIQRHNREVFRLS